MNPTLWAAFIIAALVLLLTPGPDLLAVIGRGIGQGRSAAFLAVIGYALGDVLHTVFAVVGLSAVIQSSAVAFHLVKYAGALYLVYLGIKTIRDRGLFDRATQTARPTEPAVHVLRQSIVASVLNPKTTLFFLAFLPQFVDVSRGQTAVQLLTLGATFMVLGIVLYCPIAYCAGSLGQWLHTKQRLAHKLRWVTGSIFIGLGLRVVLPERSG